jgi:hypothetical protein
MKITIEFGTDNASFDVDQYGEVKRILQQVGSYAYEYMLHPNYQLGRCREGHSIVDTNGNTIGKFKIKL